MNNKNIKNLSPIILRFGLAIVFIWFGTNQIINQAEWVYLIPQSILSITGLTASTVVLINGVFEIIMAALLACGIQIRIVAILLSLHLLMIIGDVGINAIGIRDIGLLFGMVSVALHGGDMYSYDKEYIILE